MIYRLLIIFLFAAVGISPGKAQVAYVADSAFDQELSSLLDFTVPLMTVNELQDYTEPILILDAREIEEYEVSHIPSAIHIGYDRPAFHKLDQIDKNQTIVLYCSVGYRSEKLGEKLQEMGYVNVLNLYGSIFEWANSDKPLENLEDQPTIEVHTYNKSWSQWINNPDIKKVY